jgi:hypothetical protein
LVDNIQRRTVRGNVLVAIAPEIQQPAGDLPRGRPTEDETFDIIHAYPDPR